MVKEIQYCTRCLMPGTRPRLWFDERGVCGACVWAEEKATTVDWPARWTQLEQLCRESRQEGRFDCIVPVSGGKDSSYVAYMMKHKLGLNPLCITITPGLPLDIGQRNLRNFVNSGYDLLQVDVNPRVLSVVDRIGLVDQGRPLLGWMTAVQTAIFKLAVQLHIRLVMFGEEGETEYGGSSRLKDTPFYGVEDGIELYLSGSDPSRYADVLSPNERIWMTFPSQEELRRLGIRVAHFSHFENWDPYHHYMIAKEFCGLQESAERSQGTYNNFAQTDTILYNLHVHLMYLKFGFGRCTQDVGIDIRRGALTRKQGLALVRKYDREEPTAYIDQYLDYFRLTRAEYDSVIARHVNKELFTLRGGAWEPTFEIR